MEPKNLKRGQRITIRRYAVMEKVGNYPTITKEQPLPQVIGEKTYPTIDTIEVQVKEPSIDVNDGQSKYSAVIPTHNWRAGGQHNITLKPVKNVKNSTVIEINLNYFHGFQFRTNTQYATRVPNYYNGARALVDLKDIPDEYIDIEELPPEAPKVAGSNKGKKMGPRKPPIDLTGVNIPGIYVDPKLLEPTNSNIDCGTGITIDSKPEPSEIVQNLD